MSADPDALSSYFSEQTPGWTLGPDSWAMQSSYGGDGRLRSWVWRIDRWVELMREDDIGIELAWESKTWRTKRG